MVDFQQFPNQFVELINFCQRGAESFNGHPLMTQNAFVCVFEHGVSGEGLFKIVQQNQFKASDHLRLRFKRGNDETIKKYLASKLKDYKETNALLSDRLQSLE
jgi:hypothetical protein